MNQSFRHIPIIPVLNTSDHDLVGDFFAPLLAVAQQYDRGVGYFSSGWLRINADGMSNFAHNGGKARWITSPILDSHDWEALQAGDAAREEPTLFAALARTIADLSHTLAHDTLSALAWMIADEVLTFKLALPHNRLERGDFHDKFGIFTAPDGEQIAFNGSYNDSIQGTRNYESIKVFCSWEPAFAPLVEADVRRFEQLWHNEDPNVRVFDIPEAARAQILRLRTSERPYPEPAWLKQRQIAEPRPLYQIVQPHLPTSLALRSYQQTAIEAWFAHDCRGLLEMATGTGKTITALAASVRLYQREQRLALVIAVPYTHLVDQWNSEAQAFGYTPLLAYQSKKRWLDALNEQIVEFNAGHRRILSVIVTHDTWASDLFQHSIARLRGPTLLLADEAHHLGAERSRAAYPAAIGFRLALSATPDRWFDDAGTAALRTYFGATVFTFSLQQAIGISLTPYRYHPHLVPLTDDEMRHYHALSVKIARIMQRDDDEGQRILKTLLLRRAELLNNAVNKIPLLQTLLQAVPYLEHTLFYCSPGQIDELVRVLAFEKGLRVDRFTAEESTKKRQTLLAAFAAGDIQGLVAMKCLDEGVDVPSTRTAYFLASSGNPREFIQRRGRILRRAVGKDYAVLHDLIAVPPTVLDGAASPWFEAERSMMRRELARFKEFSQSALNHHQALDVVWNIAKTYGLLDF